jgi:DNA-binding PadR family transcriptional regulator
MYELIILVKLMGGPAHGYLIAKIINDIIGPFAKLSNGRLYPLLAKLEQEGMIAAQEEPAEGAEGGRPVRSYRITEAGRNRFHRLMMDTTSNPGDYQNFFWQKVHAFGFLKVEERLHLLDHYINYCQSHVLHTMAEREDLEQHQAEYFGPHYPERLLEVMSHIIDQWQLELAWAKRLRAKEGQTTGEPEITTSGHI